MSAEDSIVVLDKEKDNDDEISTLKSENENSDSDKQVRVDLSSFIIIIFFGTYILTNLFHLVKGITWS